MIPYLDPRLFEQPDAVAQILAAYSQNEGQQGQQYDPNAVQGMLNIPPIAFPKGQTMEQYGRSSTAPQGNMLTNARVGAQNPPAQPQGSNLPLGYEEYMKYFSNTLPAEPTLDTKKRNQLATVAAINALGGMLKNVVDLHQGSQHGSPINVRGADATIPLLSQYEKEHDEYQQRKDRYDLTKTNTMQEAFKYAYGDERDREDYEQQLGLVKEQNKLAGERETAEQKARRELYQQSTKDQTTRDKTQQGYDLEKIEEQYKNESALIGQRNQDALTELEKKYGLQTAQKTAMALAQKSLTVTDEDPNKPIVIPPQIYMDVLQKQIALQNQDMSEFLTSTDFNASNNAGDIMVSRYWKDFYKPIYDDQGNVISWQSKGPQYGDVGGQKGSMYVPVPNSDTNSSSLWGD